MACNICISCGGDSGTSDSGGGSSDITTSKPESQSFPLDELSYLQNESTGNIFSLSDSSAWLITGVSGGLGNAGRGLASVTIYHGAENLVDPDEGIRSDYYMLAEDSSTTFFVKPLYLNPVYIGQGEVQNHTTGDIFFLDDDSTWLITGTFGGWGNTTRGSAIAMVYESSNEVPDATDGVSSGYVMVMSETGTTFFIRPLYLKRVLHSQANFQNHTTGDIFSLDDNSTWLITGTFGGWGNTTRGSAIAMIYESSNEVPDVTDGVSSGYVMLTTGSGTTFFVDRIE